MDFENTIPQMGDIRKIFYNLLFYKTILLIL